MKFNTKLTLGIAAVLCGTVLSFFIFFFGLARNMAAEKLEEKALALARNLAANGHDAVYTEDLYKQLDPLLENALTTSDVVSVVARDASGRTLASGGAAFPEAAAGWSGSGRGRVYAATAPVFSPVSGLTPDNVPIGSVTAVLSFEKPWAGIRKMLVSSILFSALLIALGLSLAALLAARLTRPLRRILKADEAVVRGDAAGADIPEEEIPADEIGRIMRSRLAMMSALRNAEAEQRVLREKESRRAADLEKAYAELKAIREQLTQAEKLSVLGRVLSGVAHEINNPLTGIIGFSTLLLKEKLVLEHPQIREDLSSILSEANRCQEVVKGLTAFARKRAPERAYISINELIEQSLKLEAPQLRSCNISVRRELAPDLPGTMADFHQLQQVFMNLFINAQQIMTERRGSGTLTVRTRLENGRIRAEVEDDGPGISEENFPRIFEPFFTTKAPGKGTGLGLSLSYGIISEHGGSIRAESPPGKGATFIVEIPVVEEAGVAAPEAGEAAPLPAGLNILVVDDEEFIRKVFARILRYTGCLPDTAADGAEAVRKLKDKRYDAVYCDMRMPIMGGRELYDWVCANKPELIPRWVFMTGELSSELISPVDEETGRPCLRKPFSPDTIIQSLRDLLRGAPGGTASSSGAPQLPVGV